MIRILAVINPLIEQVNIAITEFHELDIKPSILKMSYPDYPQDAAKMKTEGKTLCNDATGDGQPTSSINTEKIYQIEELSGKPSIEKFAEIKYPKELKETGKEGVTIVKLTVDTDGSVRTADIEKSSGEELLDQAAIASASQFHFKPGTVEGQLVKVQVLLR